MESGETTTWLSKIGVVDDVIDIADIALNQTNDCVIHQPLQCRTQAANRQVSSSRPGILSVGRAASALYALSRAQGQWIVLLVIV